MIINKNLKVRETRKKCFTILKRIFARHQRNSRSVLRFICTIPLLLLSPDKSTHYYFHNFVSIIEDIHQLLSPKSLMV